MFVVVVFLEARPEHRDKLHKLLPVHARNCLDREPGCRRFDVSEDTVDPNSFLLYEIYNDQAAHRAHLELPHYAEYRIVVDPWIRSRRVLTFQLMDAIGRTE